MKKWSKSILATSILVPTILCTMLSGGMAVHQLKRDTAVTADILLSQLDRVTAIARHVNITTAKMADRPCDEIREKMIATGALTPYIRSTGLIRNDDLVCSSVTGSFVQKVRDVYGTQIASRNSDTKIFTIAGTSSLPGQEAIVFASRADNGMTAFSIVDVRYFIDLMDSLDDENHAAMKLKFSRGPFIALPGDSVTDPPGFRSDFRSSFSQASLRVDTPFQALHHYVLRNIFFLGPLFLLMTISVLYAWQRWQNREISLANEIEKGISQCEFSVHYQPVCETLSGNCIGAEALMRWQRKDGSSISPDVFIRAAEENGMIVRLTRHLFEIIMRDVKDWDVAHPFHLGVNIAAEHLTHTSFTNDVLRLQDALNNAFNLVLEITERSLVEDTILASEKLHFLRQRGCLIAVDDFGTGYCSLNLLQSLPVDYLKIDKSFIDTLTSAGADTPILDTIVSLSHRLGLTIIAEGISTAHQAAWLKKNKVSSGQGYYYSRPLPTYEFYRWYKGGINHTRK